jgi:hypothetical protein
MESYKIELYPGISADTLFLNANTLVSGAIFILTTLAVKRNISFRNKKFVKLDEDDVNKMVLSANVLSVVLSLLTLVYAVFHIYAAIKWNITLIGTNRLTHGIVLLGTAVSLLLSSVVTLKNDVQEELKNP